jgi:hypothetical protein
MLHTEITDLQIIPYSMTTQATVPLWVGLEGDGRTDAISSLG